MNHKQLLIGAALLAVFLVGIYQWYNTKPVGERDATGTERDVRELPPVVTEDDVLRTQSNDEADDTPAVVAPSEAEPPVDDRNVEAEMTSQVSEPAVIETIPTMDPLPTVGGYTWADVARHDSAESCWTVIDGTVYDLTTFIKKHPGGSRAILRLCGGDGTEEFMDQHGGERRPERTLIEYTLGVLQS